MSQKGFAKVAEAVIRFGLLVERHQVNMVETGW